MIATSNLKHVIDFLASEEATPIMRHVLTKSVQNMWVNHCIEMVDAAARAADQYAEHFKHRSQISLGSNRDSRITEALEKANIARDDMTEVLELNPNVDRMMKALAAPF